MKLSVITGTQEPEATDPPAGHTQMTALVDNLERYAVSRFATAAARDAAIPSPTEGMLCYVTGTGLVVYRSGLWRPPAGMVVDSGSAGIPNLNTVTLGLYDLIGVAQGTTFPYQTKTIANASIAGGYGGGPVSFRADMYSYGTGGSVGMQSPVWCQNAHMGYHPITSAWVNAPNSSVGFKVRMYFDAGPNIHTGGTINYLVVAT